MEMLKAQVDNFEDCARVVLNVERAVWQARGRGMSSNLLHNVGNKGSTPIEVDNFQHGNLMKAQQEQRKKVLGMGACFRCHKVGRRPHLWCTHENNVKVNDE